MTNSVDSIIYGALFLLLLFFSSEPLKTVNDQSRLAGGPPAGGARYPRSTYTPALITTLLALSFAAPFLLTFKPFVEGLALAPEHSPLWQLLILWGGFLPLALGFLLYFFRRLLKAPSPQHPITPTPQDAFLVLLIVFSLLLILFPELFYFKDIYTTQPRANTLFKFSYQAFILFSLITPYLFFRLVTFWEKRRIRKILWTTLFAGILIITSTYPFFSLPSFYGELISPKSLSLNGLTYLEKTYPADYQAVLWLKNNVKGQPVILEAVGESYTDFARISANTGLPTVLGWPVHEWLWRKGNSFRELREPDVTNLYQTKDAAQAKKLINQYQVEYIVVGQLERERYLNLDEEKFGKLGTLVFTAGSTHLYRVEIAALRSQ